MYLDNNKETQKWFKEIRKWPSIPTLQLCYLLCVLLDAKILHVPGFSIPLASFPGHSQILSPTPRLWDKIWEWPGDKRGYHTLLPRPSLRQEIGTRTLDRALASFPPSVFDRLKYTKCPNVYILLHHIYVYICDVIICRHRSHMHVTEFSRPLVPLCFFLFCFFVRDRKLGRSGNEGRLS